MVILHTDHTGFIDVIKQDEQMHLHMQAFIQNTEDNTHIINVRMKSSSYPNRIK